MKWKAKNLINVDDANPLDKSDPFLVFYRKNDNGEFQKVIRTEYVLDNLNPSFQKFHVKT